jgi:hypothetical protein
MYVLALRKDGSEGESTRPLTGGWIWLKWWAIDTPWLANRAKGCRLERRVPVDLLQIFRPPRAPTRSRRTPGSCPVVKRDGNRKGLCPFL